MTTPERSCLDVMRRLGAEEGLVAADATVRAGCTTRDQLAAAITRLVGMPGVPQARLAVPLVDGAAESAPESRLRYVWVVEAGLPIPLVNPTVVTLDGMFVGRTDLLDPEAVLLGGYLAPLADWLTVPIDAELETRALAGRRMRCRVVPARLGGEAAVRGAVAMSRRAALDEAVNLPITG